MSAVSAHPPARIVPRGVKLRTPRSRKWPLQPLLDRAGGSASLLRALAARGISVGGAALEPMLGDVKADHYATALGLHPNAIWPGWDAAALTVGDDIFVNGGGWRTGWLHDLTAAGVDVERTSHTDSFPVLAAVGSTTSNTGSGRLRGQEVCPAQRQLPGHRPTPIEAESVS